MDVLESLILLGRLNAKKRNILDIADIHLHLPLHYCAQYRPDPAGIKLLVSHHPSALLVKSKAGRIPLDVAILYNKSPAVLSLLRSLTAARLATIALRTTLLLCIKHGFVCFRRSKRHRTSTNALDTLLAFENLDDNIIIYTVWSHIMTFL